MKKIGNNQIFLEFDEEFKKSKLIPLRLCIGGEYLGTLDSPTNVTSFINSLRKLLTDSYYYSEFVNDENYKCFFYSEGVISDYYRIVLEETFDDFCKRAARNNDTIISHGFCMKIIFLNIKIILKISWFFLNAKVRIYLI